MLLGLFLPLYTIDFIFLEKSYGLFVGEGSLSTNMLVKILVVVIPFFISIAVRFISSKAINEQLNKKTAAKIIVAALISMLVFTIISIITLLDKDTVAIMESVSSDIVKLGVGGVFLVIGTIYNCLVSLLEGAILAGIHYGYLDIDKFVVILPLFKGASQENAIDTTAELKKYKDLLDAGVITQEEFDEKKRQLLGL